MSTINIPGVGLVSSTALTKNEMNVLWQDLVLRMYGITPASDTDAAAYSRVRIEWLSEGQPDWKLTDDVCFVETEMEPDAYDQIVERNFAPNDDSTYTLTTIYTRVWRVRLVAYGPNSGDYQRQAKTCMNLDFVHDVLAASNLYLIYELGTPRRSPELFVHDWWERWDFAVRMNEQVTDTVVLPTMASVAIQMVAANYTLSNIIDQPPPVGQGPVDVTIYTAATISAYTAVAQGAAGLVAADSTNTALADLIIGITVGGALAGTAVSVRTSGEVTDTAWAWTLGAPIYAGPHGTLTQTPPAIGFSQIVATPLSSDTLLLDLQPAIILS